MVAFLKLEETADFMGGKGVELIMVAHVPDVLEQNSSGFELYVLLTKNSISEHEAKTSFHILIDPNVYLRTKYLN